MVPSDCDMTLMPSGNYLAVWASFNRAGDGFIHSAVFKPDGSVLRAPQLLHTTTGNNLTSVEVAALQDGRAVVAWKQSDGAAAPLMAQILDASPNHNPQGSRFQISDTDVVNPILRDIAPLAGGGFAFTYDGSVNSTGYVIEGVATASATGAWSAQSFGLHSFVSNQNVGTVLMPDGAAVVVGAFAEQNTTKIMAYRHDVRNGQDQGPIWTLGTSGVLTEIHPGVVSVGNNFVVLWEDISNNLPVLRLQAFSGTTGQAVGPATQFSKPPGQIWGNPKIVPLSNGGFAVAIQTTVNNQDDVYVAACAADGSVVQDMVAVGMTAGDQTAESIISLSNGAFAVGWVNSGATVGFVTEIFGIPSGTQPGNNSGGGSGGTGGSNVINGSNNSDVLLGTDSNDRLFGQGGADTLKGEAGNDTLSGGEGRDKLYGGKGSGSRDAFLFDVKLTSKGVANKNKDVIYDFGSKYDSIYFDDAAFTNKTIAKYLKNKGAALDKPVKMKSSFFKVGDKAADKDDFFIYNARTKKLYFDVDGSGAKAMVEIASLKLQKGEGTTLTWKDFFFV